MHYIKAKNADEKEEYLHDHFEELETACTGQNIHDEDKPEVFVNKSQIVHQHIKNQWNPKALHGKQFVETFLAISDQEPIRVR